MRIRSSIPISYDTSTKSDGGGAANSKQFRPPPHRQFRHAARNGKRSRRHRQLGAGIGDSNMIRFDKVGLGYGGSTGKVTGPEVMHDLSFDIPKGVFRWLLGPSGAGKTFLLRLMYLAIRPTSGHLSVLGMDVGEARRRALPDLRRRIGVVFQDFACSPTCPLTITSRCRFGSQAARGANPRRCHRDTGLGRTDEKDWGASRRPFGG